MELEQRVEELKNRIELMKSYYYKGFGTTIQEILTNCSSYLATPNGEDRNAVIEDINKSLLAIETYYKTIPFHELGSNQDFAPLFVVRDLLPYYGKAVREFLENPTERGIKDICFRGNAITEVGEVYRRNLQRRGNELRQIKGYENFQIIVVDDKQIRFAV